MMSVDEWWVRLLQGPGGIRQRLLHDEYKKLMHGCWRWGFNWKNDWHCTGIVKSSYWPGTAVLCYCTVIA